MNNTLRDEQSNPVKNDSQTDPATEKARILLAEDDAAMRRLLEVVLKRAGYEVVATEDGLQAMQAAGTEKFDLAVLDAIMPNLSGIELCRIFRANPMWQSMRLVLMSGMESESDCPADAHLLKSSRLQEELLETISALLAARS
ncbi:MAG: response regulator [Acidobacteriota bacterium]|nr:response regulator [Acidobacteriota bacterium]